MIVALEPGGWAESHGVQVGDQLLAIGAASVDRWVAAQHGPGAAGFTLTGPQRLVVRFNATPHDVKQAFRSVSSSALQRKRFRDALKEEAQRFEFREQLQGELCSWRPRELWPFPGLPPRAVDASLELQCLVGRGHATGSAMPRIKEMDAAARKLQSLFRWRKLWRQLDTSQEREAAARKIQAMHRGNQVRRGIAAQFAAVHPEMEVVNVVEEIAMPFEPEETSPTRISIPSADAGSFALSPEAPQPAPTPDSPRSSVQETAQLCSPEELSTAVVPQPSAMLGFFDAPDPVLEAAAVRIQAVERGRQQRKMLKAQRQAAEALDTHLLSHADEAKGTEASPNQASLFSLGPMEGEDAPPSLSPEETQQGTAMTFMESTLGSESMVEANGEMMTFVGSTFGPESMMEAKGEIFEAGSHGEVETEREKEPEREGKGEAEGFLESTRLDDGDGNDATLLAPVQKAHMGFNGFNPPEVNQHGPAVEAVSQEEVTDGPSSTRKVPAPPAKHESKSFRMAPVRHGLEDHENHSKIDDTAGSQARRRSNSTDGLPDNTLDFMGEGSLPKTTLVPRSRMQLPKAKKSPRTAKTKTEPVIKPTLAPASATTVTPEASSSWMVGAELQAPASKMGDVLGASPSNALVAQPSGFRLPKDRGKDDDHDESKAKKKKKKKKERKEDGLDNYGFQIF